MALNRRALLSAGGAAAVLPVLPGCSAPAARPAPPTPSGDRRVFLHGVASGDPDAESVVLWTRVAVPAASRSAQVQWTLYADPALRERVARGELTTGAAVDWTASVLVRGLQPGRSYYYRFEALGEASPIGRTRTLPAAGARAARIAFASCSNLPFGHFTAYAAIARRNDLDLVLHLGDYIYEYANGTYGDGSALGRIAEPAGEIVSLADYRMRYASYRLDPDLQELHRQHPVVAVWDDHETANNSWRDGAQNHDAGEGPWGVRKRAAIRAWHEWMPARAGVTQTEPRIWRSFDCGGLVDLMMLDTRIYGRDQEAGSPKDRAVIDDPTRSLLGPTQEAWLFDELARSAQRGTPWRILGQQVMFGHLGGFDGTPILNTDQWDGYAPARMRVLDHLRDAKISDVAVLTGDIHTSWAQDIARDPFGDGYDAATGRGSVAVEFVTPSVTSPGIAGPDEAEARARQALAAHPHMRYVELAHKGYVLLDITPERLVGEIWHMDTIERRDASERMASAWVTERGANHLVAATGTTGARDEREPAPAD